MIKIENTEVVGLEPAIRGMRNPKNSWDRMDSGLYCEDHYGGYIAPIKWKVGPNDHKLMMDLAKGGPVHAKYRRMIVVYVDITAPLYWWKEFDTYKVGTVANSCSTMHKIHAKEFTLNDFSCEHLTDCSKRVLEDTIIALNDARTWYLKWDHMRDEDKDSFDQNIHEKKDIWWQMIQLLPSSYNQKRTVMLNYEVLFGMYKWRKDHKLDEWRELCKWIESLPYSELITGGAHVESC